MSVVSIVGAAESFKLEQDHKRELDQKHKWALGEVEGQRGHPGRRPQKPEPIPLYRRHLRFENQRKINRASHSNNVSRKYSIQEYADNSTSDSSAEEDVKEASAAPVPDAGITYSFDAARGPGKGSEILSMAINKAVERFETKATEKLVKDEYEVVGKDSEESGDSYTADDNDFELI
ncbi:hypothetical protein MMC13_005609 [Lambiella insularis]|nr:hypothetical protein [Lambiella insularis]